MDHQRLRAVSELIRLDRPYGTLLLLLPTLWSLVIASQGVPSPTLFLVFTLGTFLMRSAGCVINDLADQDLDRFVRRTRERPLPSQRLTSYQALWVLAFLLAAAASLLVFLNPLTRWLSIAGLGLAAVYPLTKRVTYLPQMILGMAFGWGPLMAWTAVRGTLEPPGFLLFGATLLWATGYDTIYALMDREDDRKIGIKSTALLFGRHTWIALATLFGLVCFFLFLIGVQTQRTAIYYSAVLLIGLSFAYQIFMIRRNPDAPTAFLLFKSHVGIGLLILAGIILDFWGQHWSGGMP